MRYTFLNDAQSKVQPIRVFGFGAMDDSRREALNEDSSILRLLLNSELPKREYSPARLVDGYETQLWMTNQNRGAGESFYVEGSGLILSFDVGYPVFQSAEPESAADPEVDADDAWERARANLNGSKSIVVDLSLAKGKPAYNARQVEALAAAVQGVLAKAHKVESLSNDESITVYARGPSSEPGKRSVMAWRIKMSDASDDEERTLDRIESSQYLEPVRQEKMVYGYYERGGPNEEK